MVVDDDPYAVPLNYREADESARLMLGRRVIRRMSVVTLIAGLADVGLVWLMSPATLDRALVALLVMMVTLGLVAAIWSGRRWARFALFALATFVVLIQLRRVVLTRVFLAGVGILLTILQVGSLLGYFWLGGTSLFSTSVRDLLDYRREVRDLGGEPLD